MALTEWMNRLKGIFARGAEDGSRRPDGGTSCYRPLQKRMPGEENAPAQMASGEGNPPVQYAHTGFTGMNPPVNYSGSFSAQTAYQQQMSYGQPSYARENSYGMPAYGQSAPGQPAMVDSRNYARTGMNPMSYGQERAQSFAQPVVREEPQPAARPERGWFASRENRQPNNISYMPGVAPDSSFAGQTVHIIVLTGLKSCYEAIECMKNGETLIVTMEAIANEGESVRCQDMLAGAAFTLGCGVRSLQGPGLVLIAPESVRVLPEQPVSRAELPPQFARAPETPQIQQNAPGRRERRSSPRAEEFNAARNGERNNYNPYTGTMPAAAGAYGTFGGYGY